MSPLTKRSVESRTRTLYLYNIMSGYSGNVGQSRQLNQKMFFIEFTGNSVIRLSASEHRLLHSSVQLDQRELVLEEKR